MLVDVSANGNTVALDLQSASSLRNNGIGVLLNDASPGPTGATFTGMTIAANGQEGIDCDVDKATGGATITNKATFTNVNVVGNCKTGFCRGIAVSSGTLEIKGTSTVNSNNGDGIEASPFIGVQAGMSQDG